MATESVKHGWPSWEDHSINRHQWTLTEKWATILMAILGVCLSLCWPCILSVILFYSAKCRQKWQGSPRVENAWEDEESHEASHLLGNSNGQPPESYGSTPAAEVIERDQVVNRSADAPPTHKNGRSQRTVRKWFEDNTMLGIVVVGVFVAWAIGSLFSAGIANNRTALWDSEHCGVWKFNSSAAGFDAATRHDIYDRQKEARAGEYAQNCYGSADLLKSGRCNLFYQPTIKYNREPRWGCPFFTDKICVQGQQPLHFYTDLIDPNDIGINSKHLFKFRRNSTCTPLTWEDSYVRNETAKNGETTYYYEFGSTGHNYNYTYSTTGNPHDWHAPSYVVRTYGTTPWPEQDAWQPIPELKPPQNKTLTIIFISALRIFYPKQNRDPIFPANRRFGSGDHPWYWKSDPKARALACIDSSEICTYDGAKCWPTHDLTHGGFSDISLPPEYWYTKLSLENSNIYDSIKTRLGDGLVAQGRVSQYQSQDLGDAHWRVEAERLFQTSLARIQYDAWAIGTGEDQARVRDDGYANDTPDEAGNLCGILKFRSSDYRNVPQTLYLCLMSIYPGLLLLSMKVKTAVNVGKWIKNHCYLECCTKRRQKGKELESVPPGSNAGADTGAGSGAGAGASADTDAGSGAAADAGSGAGADAGSSAGTGAPVGSTERTRRDLTQDTQPGLAKQDTPPNATQNATLDGTESITTNPWRSPLEGARGDGAENASGTDNLSDAGNSTDDATADAPQNSVEGSLQNSGAIGSETTEGTPSADAEEDKLEPPVIHWIIVVVLWGLVYGFFIVLPLAIFGGLVVLCDSVRDWFRRQKVAPAKKRISTTPPSENQAV